MVRILIILLIAISCTATYAQDVIIKYDGQNLQVVKERDKIWKVIIDGEEYLLLPQEIIAGLSKKIEDQKAVIEHRDTLLAIQKRLIQGYERFENAANEHISNQEKIIEKADELYTGYKSLYSDLKKISGLSKYSILAGVGLAQVTENEWKPIVSFGFGYRNWYAQYQLRKNYGCLVVGFRLPL